LDAANERVTKRSLQGVSAMNHMTISIDELSALNGLSHMQQLCYLRGIRPYVDYQTGMVGIKRGISYQSLTEALYVEPHQGIASGSPSKDQVRRAVKSLERAGLLCIESLEKRLVVRCILISQGYSNQNKAATNPPRETASFKQAEILAGCESNGNLAGNHAMTNCAKAAMPLKDSLYIYFSQNFENFWALYPLKKSKQKAWEQFQLLELTRDLLSRITTALQEQIQFHGIQRARGLWVAPWKYPANWLAQQCWEDEVDFEDLQEGNHAANQTNHVESRTRDSFWESCKAGTEFEPEPEACQQLAGNVIAFSRNRPECQVY